MSFLDDNYLDGIITRMTAEHKANIMRTAKRLNLPDDDVLFLYIGAVEYTVQLCEDILYNDSLNVLGRNLVKWNIDRILKCQEDKNQKCTLWIVPPPEQRK